MPKKPRKRSRKDGTKDRARAAALEEAAKLRQAEKDKRKPTAKPEEHPLPAVHDGNEHRQDLTIYHPLQEDPNHYQPPELPAETKPAKTGPGRYSLYTDECCLIVEQLAKQGATDEQIFTALGIGKRTFYEWKLKHPHFSHALNKYRGLANMYVENALFRTALGYNYTEEQVSKDGDAVEVKKHQTGSVAAQKFYLTNRMPDLYKNKVETTLQLGEDISQTTITIKRREE